MTAAVCGALALAAPAGGETTEPPAAAPAPATETAAAAEEAQPAASEEVEVTQAPSTPAEPVDAGEASDASGSPVAAPVESGAAADSPPTPPASLPDEPAPAAPVEPQVAVETAPEPAVASAGGRASEPVEAVREAAAGAAAPIVDRAVGALRSQASLEAAQSTVRVASSSAELLSRTATPVREALDRELVATPVVKAIVPSAPVLGNIVLSARVPEAIVPSAPSPVGFGSPTPAGSGAIAAGRELGDSPPGQRIRGLLGHALATQPGAYSATEVLRRAAARGTARSAGYSPAAMTAAADASRGRVATAQPNDPHRHRPAPPPGSPAAASGSGGSFFVPLAALLALLALAAPATLRRVRVVPDLPAPTPFVCALERPG